MCGFAEAMLLDLAGTPVEVKLVLPGPIETEIWDQPDNEPALIDVDKVPAAECAAGIADAIAEQGVLFQDDQSGQHDYSLLHPVRCGSRRGHRPAGGRERSHQLFGATDLGK